MKIRTIEWVDGKVKIIDQTKLPAKLQYIYIKDVSSLWKAIKELKVRGAPALAAAAAFSCYIGIKNSQAKRFGQFMRELDRVITYMGSCRPTARNLFWALERIRAVTLANKDKSLFHIKKLILKEAKDIVEEDRAACRKIGFYGEKMLNNNDTVLTICNAGILATIDYGTALGVIYKAKERGKNIKVYACETRPLLQGARLTAWELKKKGVDVTLICDNMAATLMKEGKIDKVVTGADRIALSGDSANKIGTYNLAVLSHYHGIPFYIAAPKSTFDLNIKSGKDIPIEERNAKELTRLFFKKPIAPLGTSVFNPAFDVTPNDLITAFITDMGIIKPPYKSNIVRVIGK